MNILEQIINYKYSEVQESKILYPITLLEQSLFFQTPTISLSEAIKQPNKLGIIAEFKRQSPSKGIINAHSQVEDVSAGYIQAGASAVSILTDQKYFGGNNQDLTFARHKNSCPLLRKDFIIDEYQIIEAKSIGADAILLIANVLDKHKLLQLAQFAHSLKLEVLCEIHHEKEIDKLNEYINIVGVNNRNLETFEVSIETSLKLLSRIPNNFLKISESGIGHPAAVVELKKQGYDGFLIGENFMKNPQPHLACKAFINQINELISSAY